MPPAVSNPAAAATAAADSCMLPARPSRCSVFVCVSVILLQPLDASETRQCPGTASSLPCPSLPRHHSTTGRPHYLGPIRCTAVFTDFQLFISLLMLLLQNVLPATLAIQAHRL